MRSDEIGAYRIWAEAKRLSAIDADSSLAEAMKLNAMRWIQSLVMKGHTLRPRTDIERELLTLSRTQIAHR